MSTAVDALPASALMHGASQAQGSYLLVFEGDSTRLFRLPAEGEVLVGRGESVQLRLAEVRISRTHARLTVTRGQVSVEDAGSQNGTLLNGERLVDPRVLVTGDTLSMCGVTLVFHGGPRTASTRAPLPLSPWRERLEEELERAVRFSRALSVLVLKGERPLDAGTRADLVRTLRRMDVLGDGGPEEVLVLLPETGPQASEVARRLLRQLSSPGSIRAGVASYPGDGCDADALLSGARQAARCAQVGETATVPETSQRYEVGERSLLVADPAMVRLYGLIRQLARAELPVLVTGETGSGKELVAGALHHWSARAGKPFVAVNCAALPEELAESELFGHERGAFSGATSARVGFLEAADGGTLFLDELGELPLRVQAKLLRALDTQRFTRVGDTRERSVRVRLVAATNRDLQEDVRRGLFRQDLYFRLGAARLWLPPLRDRPLELPLLARRFLAEACQRAGRPSLELSAAALEQLARHPWPGNVRELRHAMDFLVAAVGDATVVEPAHLEPVLSRNEWRAERTTAAPPATGDFAPIDEEVRALEQARMRQALAASGGNKTQAAALIQMPLRTFLTKLKRYGLAPTSEHPGASGADEQA